MQLLIKNMVCNRCVRVVREELEAIGLSVLKVELGMVTINHTDEFFQYNLIRQTLQKEGFELIEDHKTTIVERIKHFIINEIHHHKGEKNVSQNFSDFLVKKTGYEYSYLSSLFSATEKTTIEKFIIAQKIERTKALLMNGDVSLSEIAWQLDYSSVAHLSNQFKQVVGVSPTVFKSRKENTLIPIDAVKKHVSLA
ncbi:AraC family transcriptional regulator [Emticicia sp. 21SJ11W-3]|uniref:AraC family transcriptional regulator n=1 Tax=Emticicia sp. 21SJ11W-3 TaxID=2916755 RepID=UPI00209E08D8|nr:AraC family transcriptional regulator [Emticicia sp. 21SJ11W-3]UTA70019.1 AraC family transcriptional regulator [Emticicia sp. 21SJ11W-3]